MVDSVYGQHYSEAMETIVSSPSGFNVIDVIDTEGGQPVVLKEPVIGWAIEKNDSDEMQTPITVWGLVDQKNVWAIERPDGNVWRKGSLYGSFEEAWACEGKISTLA